MPRKPQDLTHKAIINQKTVGYHRAAENLYLRVDDKGNRAWLFRYMIDGKAKKLGLGSLSTLSLAAANKKAMEYREQIKLGIDPQTIRADIKNKTKLEQALAKAKGKTFKQCAESYIATHKDGWRNAKHVWQWSNSLEKFAYPILGDLPVQAIDVSLVMNVLEPIWKKKNETATRLRGRIESILDWAKVREYRQGENPARWRGHLENLLAKPSKIHKIKHYPSLPYAEINGFLTSVHREEGSAAIALQILIYTATRSGETIKAKWDEFDLKQKIWTVPAERTKTAREHRIPLSDTVLDILKQLGKNKVSDYVFPNQKLDSHLSDMAMLAVIRRMNAAYEKPRWIDPNLNKPIVSHGFRSTFRTWCAEQTHFPREVAEAAMSHIIGSKVETSYQRGDFLEKRRLLMETWARYCQAPSIKNSGSKISRLRAQFSLT